MAYRHVESLHGEVESLHVEVGPEQPQSAVDVFVSLHALKTLQARTDTQDQKQRITKGYDTVIGGEDVAAVGE